MSKVPAGRLRKEEDSKTKDDGPDVTDAHSDAVRSSILSVFGTIVDAIGDEDTDGDE